MALWTWKFFIKASHFWQLNYLKDLNCASQKYNKELLLRKKLIIASTVLWLPEWNVASNLTKKHARFDRQVNIDYHKVVYEPTSIRWYRTWVPVLHTSIMKGINRIRQITDLGLLGQTIDPPQFFIKIWIRVTSKMFFSMVSLQQTVDTCLDAYPSKRFLTFLF